MKKMIFALSLCISSNVLATHGCPGKARSVDIARPDRVQVNIEGIGDGNLLCSLGENHGHFSPEGCKAIYSMLLSAKMSDKSVRLFFINDTNTDCNKGSWKDIATEHGLYYVRLEG